MASAFPLPAHRTKHISLLKYPFRTSCFYLSQLDNGKTNGSALWLGAQCLSLYLTDVYTKKNKSSATSAASAKRLRVIELGSGIGLSALVMSALGWDVVATDLSDVISSVLSSNIARNLPHLPCDSGDIHVRVLDWTVPPERWVWDNSECIASNADNSASAHEVNNPAIPPFDLIISSDTVYTAEIAVPLLRTLHTLSTLPVISFRPPPIYLCVERRDSTLIDSTLTEAKDKWGFQVDRVPQKKIARAMEKGGLKWDREEWDGVEIWKLILNRAGDPLES